MILPVMERFAEYGWQPFVDPGETYEFFTVSGIFKRAKVVTPSPMQHKQIHERARHERQLEAEAAFEIEEDLDGHMGNGVTSPPPPLVQRNALFDVCLRTGLAHLIVAYVRAVEAPSVHAQATSAAVVGKTYVLRDPIAVQQWLWRRVEALETRVHAEMDAFDGTTPATMTTPTKSHHGRRLPRASDSNVETCSRELNGLRAIAIALVERLKEGARQLSDHAAHGGGSKQEQLKQTELARLTQEGIHTLLEALFRIQAAVVMCRCVSWLREHEIVFDSNQYQEFYYQARQSRTALRQSFEGSYDVALSSISNSELEFPSLLIELVMESANVTQLVSLPPRNVGAMITPLVHATNIREDLANFYSDDVENEPVEAYFRVQTALLLYFHLDLAYLTLVNGAKRGHVWTGAEVVERMLDAADSFAAHMGVREDMAATLVAIWLIENAVNVELESEGEVMVIYQSAVTRLLESSAMQHLQREQSGLEPNLVLYLAETLVHRGESAFAWKIWTAFTLDLTQLPQVATDYAVMVNLELCLWERAVSLLREQKRLDLLELVFKWLLRSGRVKELVQTASLDSQEESCFDAFMMGDRVAGVHVLQEDAIRKADLLVMYYVLRNQFDRAWALHHEHLALIRESTAGDTLVAQAVVGQASFRVRQALLENMRAEPAKRPSTSYNFKRSIAIRDAPSSSSPSSNPLLQSDADVRMTASGNEAPLMPPVPSEGEEDDAMGVEEHPQRSVLSGDVSGGNRESAGLSSTPSSASSSDSPSSAAYSPGIFSSRSAQPRTTTLSSPLSDSAVSSTPAEPPTTNVSHSLPRRNSLNSMPTGKNVAQALDFGSSPAGAQSNGHAEENMGSTESSGRRQALTPPVRSRFNTSFSNFDSSSSKPSNSEDLALRATTEESVDATPMDVQVSSNQATERSDGISQPSSSGSSTTTSTVATAASQSTQDAASVAYETPKRFQFVREPPQSDSRLTARATTPTRSPASQELDGPSPMGMELEPIDEEFNTPMGASRGSRGQDPSSAPSSAPVRRNPRRTSRNRY